MKAIPMCVHKTAHDPEKPAQREPRATVALYVLVKIEETAMANVSERAKGMICNLYTDYSINEIELKV